MDANTDAEAVELFSTCPPFDGSPGYLQRAIEVARWSERAGCRGILIYSDNSQLDPWLVAQAVVSSTERLCPLVAVQPVYMHPYAVAKSVATLAHQYGRRTYLNMVAGGFKNDLDALGDGTPHDRRYDRLVEYTNIVTALLHGGAVTQSGESYAVRNLSLLPRCPPELAPVVFVSGSSPAGLAAARAIGAVAIKYPKPSQESAREDADDGLATGVRVGIVARAGSAEAWAAAEARFPPDRAGQLKHQLAMKVSDSVWHQQLSELGVQRGASPYWLVPFENYKTMCPYLVGDYAEVGRELAAYIALGHRSFITDVPAAPEELEHIGRAFTNAIEAHACQSYSRTG